MYCIVCFCYGIIFFCYFNITKSYAWTSFYIIHQSVFTAVCPLKQNNQPLKLESSHTHTLHLHNYILYKCKIQGRESSCPFSCNSVSRSKLRKLTCLLALEKAFDSSPKHFTVDFWVRNFIQFPPLLHTVKNDFPKHFTIKLSIFMKHCITKLLLY